MHRFVPSPEIFTVAPTTAGSAAVPTPLRASAILTATYVVSTIVSVTDWRELTLLVSASAGAANNVPSILPLLSGHDAQPAAADDSWYSPSVYDGSVTAQVLAAGATLMTGADFSKVPEFGMVKLRPMEIRLETTDNATDEIRIAIPIDVRWAKWFCFHAADVGSGTLTTLAVSCVRSA